MKHTYTISGMTCMGCASAVERALMSVKNVTSVFINLEQSRADITMEKDIPIAQFQEGLKHYPSYRIMEGEGLAQKSETTNFWQDFRLWKRASFNTLNCLIGCSIGDFGMIIFLQTYYPQTSMIVQMVLATAAGLATSILLETILLHNREGFSWRQSFQTALSMSFLSMLAMEIAMNTTDFMMTGGKAAFENPLYWVALIVALIVGFLTPLPYNYYKLKKFNKACH